MHTLLPLLAALRRETGLPHKIVVDEAHYYLGEPDGRRLIDAELAGYILVTYKVSGIDPAIRAAADTVVMVTRETDEQEQVTLRSIAASAGADVPEATFRDLNLSEAALLPGAEESHGRLQRFQIAPRLTAHVRHRAKYLDMPVVESQAFVFTHDGQAGARAFSLKDLVSLLSTVPEDQLAGHLKRHDFSRWLGTVFRDCPLATHLRAIEDRSDVERPRDVTADIAQAIRARYETPKPIDEQPAGVGG
jgi:hypothetical protein